MQLLVVLVVHGGELEGPFLVDGTRRVEWSLPVRTYPDRTGYDGQFFLMLAQDPFLRGRESAGLDLPRYRANRILWPLLAWATGFGDPVWRMYGLFLWNAVFVAVGAWALAHWAVDYHRSPLWGLLYPLHIGVLVCLWRMLGDVAATSLLLLTVLALARGYERTSAACLALALLARETALVAAVVLIGHALVRRNPRTTLLYLSAVGIAGMWWGYVWHVSAGSHAPGGAGGIFGPPFAGIAQGAGVFLGEDKPLVKKLKDVFVMGTYVAGMVHGIAIGAAAALRRSGERPQVALMCTAYSLLGISLSYAVWQELWSYSRVLLPALALGWMAAVQVGVEPWRGASWLGLAHWVAGAVVGVGFGVYLLLTVTP